MYLRSIVKLFDQYVITNNIIHVKYHSIMSPIKIIIGIWNNNYVE